MTTSPDLERSRSFGAHAELYDRLRPGYPPGAIAAVLSDGARRVADVGAGTGKLTAALITRGLTVVAVEPDGAMRAVLTKQMPDVDVRAGLAEALPLADASVDAVLFAQSWHWVDDVQAAREAARVLHSDGTLAMLWNLHDDRVPWVAELERITATSAVVTGFKCPSTVVGFEPASRVDVSWQQTLTPDQLADLARTWSSVSTLPAGKRDDVLDAVRRLLVSHLALAGQGQVDFPYVCSTWTYRRPVAAIPKRDVPDKRQI